MSGVCYLMSYVWCKMYDVRRLMSSVWCQTSDVKCFMSYIWCLVFVVWCQTFDVLCLTSDIILWCQTSDVSCQMSDVWCIISDYMLAINSSHGHAFVFLSLHLPHIINPLLNKKSSIKPPLSYKPPPPHPFRGRKLISLLSISSSPSP